MNYPQNESRTMNPIGDPVPDARPRSHKATPLQVARIVVSGLFMIGQKRDFGPDAPRIDPVHLVVGALIGFALIIAAMLWLVSAIVR